MSTNQETDEEGKYISVGDIKIYIVERGSGFPIFVLHGGPGLDHHQFADYLDGLTDEFKLILVDQRGQGLSDLSDPKTWTLNQMAMDIDTLAKKLNLNEYAVFGHSFGAFVALQYAIDFPGHASKIILSGGVPATKYFAEIETNLKNFEPIEIRERVAKAFEQERIVKTQNDVEKLRDIEILFFFKVPTDPLIEEYTKKTSNSVYSPKVIKYFAETDTSHVDLENLLPKIKQPVLILSGRFDRISPVKASEVMAEKIPNSHLVIFENSSHMLFVEENTKYLKTIRSFLKS